MAQESIPTNESLIPPPIPDGAQEFSRRVQGLLDGRPKDEATVNQAVGGMEEMFDRIAAGLYSMASMLVGEGEESVRLVETAVADAEVASGQDAAVARKSSRRALCEAALQTLAARDAESLAAPEGLEHVATCIEDDDLDAAGVSGEELARMMAGPDRDRVRNWLASLQTARRAIFVFRAVAGFKADETAQMLAACGGPKAAGWTAEGVRELFRQALCSLASQMIQASVGR